MRAIVYKKYGGPEVLELREIEKPIPAKNQVLVKIYATSVTAGDWRMRKAEPFLARMYNGLLRPRKVNILGFEVAGIVEEVGQQVDRFMPGDKVFAFCGFKFGGYAEYRCFNADDYIVPMPEHTSFEEAATTPTGALTALNFLRMGKITAGQDVMIYGASGSVGTFAVQIAKYYRAHITAVCSTKNLELVKSLGADQVLDYTKQDLGQGEIAYDLIFDAVGKIKKSKCKHLLKPTGKFVSVSGNGKIAKEDMQFIRDLMEKGALKSVIDRTYALEEIQEAHRYVEQFRKRGNVAIRLITK